MPPDFVFEWSEPGMFIFLLALAGSVAAIVHLTLNWWRLRAAVKHMRDISPVLQTLCGTLFVLSVTFLASNVWQTEERAKEYVAAEARSIREIRIYLEPVAGETRETILKALNGYTGAVAAEWQTMADDGGSVGAETSLATIYGGVLRTGIDPLLQQRTLAALDNLALARQGRLNIAQEYLSSSKWTAVLLLGLFLLIAIGVCHAHAPAGRATALALMSFAIALSLFVILAHDRPFVGYLALSPAPILQAMETAS